MGRAGLLLVIFSLGCTTPKAAEKPAEPVKTEPVAEPAKTEPVAEPVKAEPVAEPVKAEPVAEPVKTEPVKTEPVKTEPVKTEPVKTEPVKTEPVKTEPVKTEPVKTEPVKTAPVKTEPVKAQPVKTEPVKTEPVKVAEPVKTEPVKVAEPDAKIARMWKSKCGSCHGADGKAATTKGKKMLMNDLSTKAWQASKTDAQLKKAIVEGVKAEKNGVAQEMDAYSELSAADVDALVKYVRWLGPH